MTRSRPIGRCLALALSCVVPLAACAPSSASSSDAAGAGGNGFIVKPESKPTTTQAITGATGPSRPPTGDDPTATSGAAKAAPVAIAAGQATSEPFRFHAGNLAGGADVDGELLYAKAPLMMTFVTPWCPVCIQEGPMLAATIKAHPEITFVFVHASASPTEYQAYIDGAGIDGPNVVHLDDTDGAVWRRFNVASQPSFVMVDRKGLMRASTGALDEAGLAKATALVANGIV